MTLFAVHLMMTHVHFDWVIVDIARLFNVPDNTEEPSAGSNEYEWY